jgi:anti-anti-sigma factor
MTRYNDVVVLTVKDDLAADAVESFVEKAGPCAAAGSVFIVVDCGGLSGFDSAGLEALVDLQNKCEAELGAVKLCGLDETATKILEITRLSRRFEAFDDLDAAVKSFS